MKKVLMLLAVVGAVSFSTVSCGGGEECCSKDGKECCKKEGETCDHDHGEEGHDHGEEGHEH